MHQRSIPILLALVAGTLCSHWAHATLRSPTLTELSTGEAHDGTLSELWFSVVDPVGETSYTLDLGVTLQMMRLANADNGSASSLVPAGNNIAATFVAASDATRDYAFWVLDVAKDAAWGQFRAATTAANLGTAVWTVMGADALGSTSLGGRRVLTTVGQGAEAAFRDVSNGVFNALTAPLGPFVNVGLNNRPSHQVVDDVTGNLESSIAINGSSFDTKAANPDAYFGKLVADYASSSIPSITNPIGQSAWFYDLTRSGANQNLKVVVDEFDNLGGDSYWGFIAEAGDTGRYLLSYTTQRFVSVVETQAALTFENSFAHLAGVLSVANAVGQTSEVISLTDGFLRRLVSRTAARSQVDGGMLQMAQGIQVPSITSPVPEPAGWALMGLGLAGLGLWSRRRAG